MTPTLAGMSAVIAANDVNLSILKPHWLIQNGLLRPEEIQQHIIVSEALIDIATASFGFGAFPNRLQMVFRPDACEIKCNIDRVLGGLVRLLPHTPYSAVGLNFEYIWYPPAEEFNGWTKDRFVTPFSAEAERHGANVRFGGYLSFDYSTFRVKIDCKPRRVEVTSPDPSKTRPQSDHFWMSLNFHSDVRDGDAVESVLARLAQWEEVAQKAREIAILV